MRDALEIVSYSKKMDLQMQKYITTISLKSPGVGVFKYYCNSNEVCAFVGLYCNN
jgi:hypothetical protein